MYNEPEDVWSSKQGARKKDIERRKKEVSTVCHNSMKRSLDLMVQRTKGKVSLQKLPTSLHARAESACSNLHHTGICNHTVAH